MVTQIVTTRSLETRPSAAAASLVGVDDPLTTKLLAALAETYAAEADEQAAEETPRRRAERSSLEWRSSWMPHSHS